MRRSMLSMVVACASCLLGLPPAVPLAPAAAPPASQASQPSSPLPRNTARHVPADSREEAQLERELTMKCRSNSDIDSILKVAAKASALPKPSGPVVRVRTTEELKNAIATVKDGTTILLADGVYRTDSLLLQDRAKVIIRSESGDRDKVILDGEGMAVPGKRHWALALHGTPDFTIADITMRNFDYGVYIFGDGAVHRPLVRNMKFHNIWIRGVKGTHARRVWDHGMGDDIPLEQTQKVRPRDGRIEYCLFVNDHPKTNRQDGFDGDYISGIDMMWLKNWTIADNVFIDIRGANGGGRGAIFIWVDSEDVVAERNVIVNCDRGIAFGNPSGDFPCMTRGIARNNFIVAGARQAIEFHRTDDTVACNNTIVGRDPSYERTVEFLAGNRGARFVNNLVHGRMLMRNGVEQQANIVADLAGWFVNPAAGDLHLTDKAAPALGKALPLPEVREDFDRKPRKAAPDAGAAERSL